MAATLEREIKLRFDDPEAARAAVIAAGGTPLRGRRLQEDCLLDTADGLLRERGSVLRVRHGVRHEPADLQGTGAAVGDEAARGARNRRRRRDAGAAHAGGARLPRLVPLSEVPRGVRPGQTSIIAIDETPVGTYVEIEGGERGIATATEALGRGPADYLLDSYRGLFVRHCQERGLPVTDMLFDRRAQAGMTHALVLAAGLGTRLRPLTDVCAKPAIPVAGEPIIRRIAGWLAAHGVNDLVVNLHHLPHTVTAVLGDGSDLAVRVRYSWEQPRILGSARRSAPRARNHRRGHVRRGQRRHAYGLEPARAR